MAQPAAAPADPPSALLEAARSIRAVLARGLSARRAPTAASKENASVPSAGSPLLAKFRALQTDVAEQDKVVAALRGMLRRGGAPDAAIDACIDKALFPGVDPPSTRRSATVADAIAPGASRELLAREIRALRAERDAAALTEMTSGRNAKLGGGGDFAARRELARVAETLERLASEAEASAEARAAAAAGNAPTTQKFSAAIPPRGTRDPTPRKPPTKTRTKPKPKEPKDPKDPKDPPPERFASSPSPSSSSAPPPPPPPPSVSAAELDAIVAARVDAQTRAMDEWRREEAERFRLALAEAKRAVEEEVRALDARRAEETSRAAREALESATRRVAEAAAEAAAANAATAAANDPNGSGSSEALDAVLAKLEEVHRSFQRSLDESRRAAAAERAESLDRLAAAVERGVGDGIDASLVADALAARCAADANAETLRDDLRGDLASVAEEMSRAANETARTLANVERRTSALAERVDAAAEEAAAARAAASADADAGANNAAASVAASLADEVRTTRRVLLAARAEARAERGEIKALIRSVAEGDLAEATRRLERHAEDLGAAKAEIEALREELDMEGEEEEKDGGGEEEKEEKGGGGEEKGEEKEEKEEKEKEEVEKEAEAEAAAEEETDDGSDAGSSAAASSSDEDGGAAVDAAVDAAVADAAEGAASDAGSSAGSSSREALGVAASESPERAAALADSRRAREGLEALAGGIDETR